MNVRPVALYDFAALHHGLVKAKERHERYGGLFDLTERQRTLDPRYNPFLAHVLAQPLVAERGGLPVGCVLVSVNTLHNGVTGRAAAHFSCLEADSEETTLALLEAAQQWCAKRHLSRLEGPCFLSPWLGVGRVLPLSIGERADRVGRPLFKARFQMQANFPLYEIPAFKAPDVPAGVDGVTIAPLPLRFREMALLGELQGDLWPLDVPVEPLKSQHLSYLVRRHAAHLDPRLSWGAFQGRELVGAAVALADGEVLGPPWGGPWRRKPLALPPLKPRTGVSDVHLMWLGVRRQIRRRGVGGALLGHLLAAAKGAGARRLTGLRGGGALQWAENTLTGTLGAEPVMGWYLFEKDLGNTPQ